VSGLEGQLFEARAERDEAQHRCVRLEARLRDLFAASLLSEAQAVALRHGKGPASARVRENELIATIQTLQRALARQQQSAQSMVASSRHMQVRPL
jgi:hypothetical protein